MKLWPCLQPPPSFCDRKDNKTLKQQHRAFITKLWNGWSTWMTTALFGYSSVSALSCAITPPLWLSWVFPLVHGRRTQWTSTKSSTVRCTNLFRVTFLMQTSGKQSQRFASFQKKNKYKNKMVSHQLILYVSMQHTGWCSTVLHHWRPGGSWLSAECWGELWRGGLCRDARSLHTRVCWNR